MSPNCIPYSGTLHASEDMHGVDPYLRGCKCDGGGLQTWLGLAWLGWDALPLPLQPPPQGAVEDQIRMGSQIRISLIVECLRKMDGYGIAMGPGSLRDPPIL